MHKFLKQVTIASIFILIYVLLGNARSAYTNPFIPEWEMTVTIIVPVIAGILFGRYIGLSVGFFGSLINSFSPAGTLLDSLNILPFSVIGFLAGYWNKRSSLSILSVIIILGHILRMILLLISGVIPWTYPFHFDFWAAIGFESIIGMISVVLLASIYEFARHTPTKKPIARRGPLSSDPRVWKLLLLVSFLLTIFFAILFYFKAIFFPLLSE